MRISDWSSDVCSSDLLRVIDAGNYIGAGDANGIAVITQVTPIDVVFNVPQDRVGEIRARADQGVLPAVALDRTRTTALATGNFLTLDNQVDVTTGPVRAKARFANADGALLPNQNGRASCRERVGTYVWIPWVG